MAKLVDIADGYARFDDGETLALPPCVWTRRREPTSLTPELHYGLRWQVWWGEKDADPRARGLLFLAGATREQTEDGLRYLTLCRARHVLRELAEGTGLSFVTLAAVAKGLQSSEVRDGQATFPGRGR